MSSLICVFLRPALYDQAQKIAFNFGEPFSPVWYAHCSSHPIRSDYLGAVFGIVFGLRNISPARLRR